jgi:hypothetical protein
MNPRRYSRMRRHQQRGRLARVIVLNLLQTPEGKRDLDRLVDAAESGRRLVVTEHAPSADERRARVRRIDIEIDKT